MDKLLEIPAFDRDGEPNTRVLPRLDASVFEKTAGTLPADVAEFIKELKPDPEKLYLLIVALGAADYWGSNVNGDAFFERDLLGIQSPMEASRNPEPYTGVPLPRYKTFLSAHIFKHHCNKQPENSFGKVAGSFYDRAMHRVLLIVGVDRSKAPDIVADIEKNGSVVWSMGCFTEDAMVQMADGTRTKISEMVPGSKVITHLGNVGNILNTQRRWYDGEVYDIEVFGVEGKITATPEHPFWASELDRYCRCGCGEKLETAIAGKHSFAIPVDNRFKAGHHNRLRGTSGNHIRDSYPALPKQPTLPFKFIDAQKLAPGDFLLTPASQGQAPAWVTPGIARLFGYFLAEGSYLKHQGKRNAVALSFAAGESYVRECVDLFKSEFSIDAKVYRSYGKKGGTCAEVRAHDHKITPIFYEYCGEYSDHKRLHASIMQWPRHLKMELLGAYLNGDASHGKQIQVYTCSRDLAEQMHALANSCGIASRLCTDWPSLRAGYRPGRKQKYALMIDSESANQLLEYSDVRPFDRSNQVTRHVGNINGSVYRQIKSVTRRMYSGYVYNFEVEGDNSYVVNDVAVHNCKVPFDICSACKHQAKNVTEYCEHLKTAMGQTWSNGHKVYAINSMPRFFDISRVLIPADKTAYTLMKVAAAGQRFVALGDDGTGCGSYSRSGVLVPSAVIAERVKVAAAKLSAEKGGELAKELPVGPVEAAADSVGALARDAERARRVAARERRLSGSALRKLAEHPVSQVLSSAAALGIVLQPDEFTRMLLTKMAAKAPERELLAFADPGAIDYGLVAELAIIVPERSCLSPWMEEREAKLAAQTERPAERIPEEFQGRYDQYRESLDRWDPEVSAKTISKFAHLLPEHRTASAADLARTLFGMSKAAKVGKGAILAGGILGPLGLTYLESGRAQAKRLQGKELNPAEKLVADHHLPLAAAAATLGGVGAHKLTKLVK